MKCPKCDYSSDFTSAFGACPNCNRSNWYVGRTTDGEKGVFCKYCQTGYTEITCPSCGCEITGMWLGKTAGESRESCNGMLAFIVLLFIIFYLLWEFFW